jgi:hypothetical protein
VQENEDFDAEDERKTFEALDKAIEVLRKAGLDHGILVCTKETEDKISRSASRGFGNWHAQTGLLLYMVERRKQAAIGDQQRNDFEDEGQ